MMATNRPTGSLSAPESSSSSGTNKVNAGNSLEALYKELSSVPDREPPQPTNTEGEQPSTGGSILNNPRAASSASTSTNVMIVKTIRAALSELRRP